MTCLRIVEASITITDQGAFQEYNHLAAAFSYSLQLSIPRPPPPSSLPPPTTMGTDSPLILTEIVLHWNQQI